ncbi:MAG: hypothetical protein SWK90_05155 [Chloroflexota bacterium]|nr:hypothetical protein [Chloroflexota bacterium]
MSIREFLVNNRRRFGIASIVAFVVMLVAMLYFQPWGPKLGVAVSPQRQYMRMIFEAWVKIPAALWAASIVAGKPKWLAPRGRYQEGQTYKVFTTYTYVAIALCAALFAAAGILSYEFFDLPAAPAALSVTFFNPIIGGLTLWLGGVIRSLIFGSGNPLMWLISNGISDGSTWIFLGIFYWWFREETKWGKNPILLIIYWAVVYVVWRTIWMFPIWVWYDPVPALWARMGWFFTSFIPSGLLGTLAGVAAVEALIRAVERGRQAPVVNQ